MLNPKPAFSGAIFQKYLEYFDDSKYKTSNEREQKLEVADDTEHIVSLFSVFDQDWEPVSTAAFVFLSSLFLAQIILFPKDPVLKDWAFLSSFIHSVNLVFHEAGHVLFAVFGNQTLTILGGSLNQLLIPLIVLITFIYKRDTAGSGRFNDDTG